MDKENVARSCGEILFSHEKDWSTDTSYNMDEAWEHDTKKPVTKGHISYASIYMNCPEEAWL
jgi:hypothetical protein